MSVKSREKQKKKEQTKKFGAVMTPPALVKKIFNKIDQFSDYTVDATKTVLDNSCGTGNFLVEVLERRLKAGISHLDAIKTIYGVELQPRLADTCRQRLSLGSNDPEIWAVLDINIVCADALDENHSGWDLTGYMWKRVQLYKLSNLPLKDFFDAIIIPPMELLDKMGIYSHNRLMSDQRFIYDETGTITFAGNKHRMKYIESLA